MTAQLLPQPWAGKPGWFQTGPVGLGTSREEMSHCTLGLPGKASFLLEQCRMILSELGSQKSPRDGSVCPVPPPSHWHPLPERGIVAADPSLKNKDAMQHPAGCLLCQMGINWFAFQAKLRVTGMRFRVWIKLFHLFRELFDCFKKISIACFETHQRTWEDSHSSPPHWMREFGSIW